MISVGSIINWRKNFLYIFMLWKSASPDSLMIWQFSKGYVRFITTSVTMNDPFNIFIKNIAVHIRKFWTHELLSFEFHCQPQSWCHILYYYKIPFDICFSCILIPSSYKNKTRFSLTITPTHCRSGKFCIFCIRITLSPHFSRNFNQNISF